MATATMNAQMQQSSQAGKDTAAQVATAKSDTASILAGQNQELNSWKEIVVRGFVVMVGLVLLAVCRDRSSGERRQLGAVILLIPAV